MDHTITPVRKKLTKKEVRQQVYEKLSNALAEYKTNLKEKKFTNTLRKASKLLAADFAKAIGKKKSSAKKPAKTKPAKKILPAKEETAAQA
jgi:hypothetical protein